MKNSTSHTIKPRATGWPVALSLMCLFGNSAAFAGTRASTSYSITTDIVDSVGQRAASALYGNDGSAGTVVGVSAVSGEVARNGFIGQLYELLGYGLLASDYYPAELGTTQVFTVRTADDGTNVVIPTTGFTFSIISGPLASISATGLVTAGAVYQNTTAFVGATSAAFAGQLTLPINVQDTIPDNFGSYAGDGLDDAWQFQYFGLNNPNAAPNVDADGTGQTNLFKYIAGLNPLDPNSRFTLTVQPVSGQPTQKNITFSPRLNDRTYTVTARPALTGGSYAPLTNPSAPSDSGQQRTITDLSTGGSAKFYRVEITKP